MKIISETEEWALKRLIKGSGFKHGEVAAQLGYSKGRFSNYLNRASRAPDTFAADVREALEALKPA